MKFFFDNHLAPKLAHGLNEMVEPEHRVVHLKDDFPGNTEDIVWMQALSRETDLVIVTADIRISRNPHEVIAWKQAGHTIFFLKPGWVKPMPFPWIFPRQKTPRRWRFWFREPICAILSRQQAVNNP